MEQGQCEADAVDGEDTVASIRIAVHLDIVVAPFFNLPDSKGRLHQPRQHRIQTEYNLHSCISVGLLESWCARTAKPTRVAIEELQLHDLKNIDAVRLSAGAAKMF